VIIGIMEQQGMYGRDVVGRPKKNEEGKKR